MSCGAELYRMVRKGAGPKILAGSFWSFHKDMIVAAGSLGIFIVKDEDVCRDTPFPGVVVCASISRIVDHIGLRMSEPFHGQGR